MPNMTDLDRVIADLNLQIAEKQTALARTTDEMVGLMLRRERIKEALKDVVNVVVEETLPAKEHRMDTSVVPAKASEVIVEALRKAGEKGLSGADLNAKIMDVGLSIAAADKAKARLKHAHRIRLEDGRWRLADPQQKAA